VRMLDLFCGRGGWTNAFLDRGWEVDGWDIVQHTDYRGNWTFHNILAVNAADIWFGQYDFVCASSPCEQFSVHGMKHFHPNPAYPDLGIRLFNHTRAMCEEVGVPYIMENVRAAEQFVGQAVHHCGPFYLWGTGVPPLLNQGIKKGCNVGGNLEFAGTTLEQRRQLRAAVPRLSTMKHPKIRAEFTAKLATIPPELANCVADYAERIIETGLPRTNQTE
jgi:hypothetical protein